MYIIMNHMVIIVIIIHENYYVVQKFELVNYLICACAFNY